VDAVRTLSTEADRMKLYVAILAVSVEDVVRVKADESNVNTEVSMAAPVEVVRV
jgi:hypothetical protein